MCVIIHAPAGVPFPREYIEAAWKQNPDGAGFAYTDENGNVVTVKGFMTLKHLLKRLKKHDMDSTDFTLHFRIRTSGFKDAANTHPWRIGDKVAVIHNGILTHVKAESKISDTGVWTRDRVMPWYVAGSLQSKEFVEWAEKDIGSWNKVVIHNKGHKPIILNEKAGSWHDKVWYSNEHFGGPFKKAYYAYQDPNKKWCNQTHKYIDKTPEEIEADKNKKVTVYDSRSRSCTYPYSNYSAASGDHVYGRSYGGYDEDSAEWLKRWGDDLQAAVDKRTTDKHAEAGKLPVVAAEKKESETDELEAEILAEEALELREEQDDAEQLITAFVCDEDGLTEDELFRLQDYLEDHTRYLPDFFTEEWDTRGGTLEWYVNKVDWAIWRKSEPFELRTVDLTAGKKAKDAEAAELKKSQEQQAKARRTALLNRVKKHNNLKDLDEAEEFLANINEEFLGGVEDVDKDDSTITVESIPAPVPEEEKKPKQDFPMTKDAVQELFFKKFVPVKKDGYTIWVPREKIEAYTKPVIPATPINPNDELGKKFYESMDVAAEKTGYVRVREEGKEDVEWIEVVQPPEEVVATA